MSIKKSQENKLQNNKHSIVNTWKKTMNSILEYIYLTQYWGLQYSLTLMLHSSSGVVLKNRLFSPK